MLARVAQETGEELPEDGPDPRTWVDGLVTAARHRHAEAEAAAGLAAERHAALVDELEAATLVADAHARRRTLLARSAELATAATSRAHRATALAAARNVAPIVPLVTEVARLQLQLDEARSAAAAVNAAVARTLTSAAGPRTQVPPSPAEIGALARRTRDEAVGLQALARDEHEAERVAGLADSLEQKVVTLHAAARELTTRLDEAPARRAELEAARDASVAAASTVAGLVAAAELTAARLAAGRRRDELAAGRPTLADLVRDRTDDSHSARDRWLTLRQTRLDGMAAELAAGLRDSAPCRSAAVRSTRPGASRRRRRHPRAGGPAQAAVVAAEEALSRSRSALADHDTALAAVTVEAGGDGPVAGLATAADVAAAALAAATAQAGRAEADTQAVTAFARQHDGWLREQVALDEEARALIAQAGGERARLAELRGALDAARGDDPSIAARALRLASSADDLETLRRQVETAERLDHEVAHALARAERRPPTAGSTRSRRSSRPTCRSPSWHAWTPSTDGTRPSWPRCASSSPSQCWSSSTGVLLPT